MWSYLKIIHIKTVLKNIVRMQKKQEKLLSTILRKLASFWDTGWLDIILVLIRWNNCLIRGYNS
jgi:hypothetical protein